MLTDYESGERDVMMGLRIQRVVRRIVQSKWKGGLVREETKQRMMFVFRLAEMESSEEMKFAMTVLTKMSKDVTILALDLSQALFVTLKDLKKFLPATSSVLTDFEWRASLAMI